MLTSSFCTVFPHLADKVKDWQTFGNSFGLNANIPCWPTFLLKEMDQNVLPLLADMLTVVTQWG